MIRNIPILNFCITSLFLLSLFGLVHFRLGYKESTELTGCRKPRKQNGIENCSYDRCSVDNIPKSKNKTVDKRGAKKIEKSRKNVWRMLLSFVEIKLTFAESEIHHSCQYGIQEHQLLPCPSPWNPDQAECMTFEWLDRTGHTLMSC